MSSDIARIVQQEAAWLAQQEGPVASQLVSTYQQTFLEIEQKLASIKNLSGYTANQLRATQAQLAALIETMHVQHSDKLGAHVKSIYQQQLPREGTAWSTLEKTFGDPKLAKQFANIRPVPNQRAIKALLTTQGISIKGFSDDLTREVRHVLAVSHARGEDSRQMVRRLRQVPNLPRCSPNRLRLIVRMETARSSNQAKRDHIAELQQQFPDKEFWLMIQAHVDKSKKTRNHWASWALHKTVRNVTKGERYEVSRARILAIKAEYKRITGKKASDNGLLWKAGGAGIWGMGLPAHFWDRDVETPFDPSWKGDAFNGVHHPQGPIIVQEPEPESARQADAAPESPPAEPPQLPAAVTPQPDESSRAQNELLNPVAPQTPATPPDFMIPDADPMPVPDQPMPNKPARELTAAEARLTLQHHQVADQNCKAELAPIEPRLSRLQHEIRAAGRLRSELESSPTQTPDEVLALAEKQQAARLHEANLKVERSQLRRSYIELLQRRKAIQEEMRAIFYADEPATFQANIFEGFTPAQVEQDIQPALTFVRRVMGPGRVDDRQVNFVLRPSGRADYHESARMITLAPDDTASIVVHELGHWLELASPRTLADTGAFWARRTQKDVFQKLSEIVANSTYADDEYAKPDDFSDAYMGKVGYKNPRPADVSEHVPYGDDDELSYTEILSMGLQMLYENPVRLMQKDEDTFNFLWKQITGND